MTVQAYRERLQHGSWRNEPLRGVNPVRRNPGIVSPLRQLVVMQPDQMLAEDVPLLVPRIVPDRSLSGKERVMRRAGKHARRIDLGPRRPTPTGDAIDLRKRQRLFSAIRRKVRRARLAFSRVRPRSLQPVA